MNAAQQTFQDYLMTQGAHVPILGFIINFLLCMILTFILSRIYILFGNSLSNRRIFARNFILISLTTMLVITIVKSSLALSLGLVGALSIVRFRTAIKEPEELAYLFLAIAVGLGFGANQREVTLVGFAIMSVIIWLNSLSRRSEPSKNINLTISCHNPEKTELMPIVQILKDCCSEVE